MDNNNKQANPFDTAGTGTGSNISTKGNRDEGKERRNADRSRDRDRDRDRDRRKSRSKDRDRDRRDRDRDRHKSKEKEKDNDRDNDRDRRRKRRSRSRSSRKSKRSRKRSRSRSSSRDPAYKRYLRRKQNRKSMWDRKPEDMPEGTIILPTAEPKLQKVLVAPKQSRNVYVGGIDPHTTTEKDVFDFFTHSINVAQGKEEKCVLSVYINKFNNFGFIELSTAEMATAVIKYLNGIQFKGVELALRRPTNYEPSMTPQGGEPVIMDVAKIGMTQNRLSTQVENGPDKIYVAGIPYSLTNAQIQELLESFGQLAGLCVVREKGYAFCQYVDVSKTDLACEGLNGMTVGSQTLTVKRANARPSGNVPANSSADLESSILAKLGGLTGALNPMGDGMVRPSRILVLLNMVKKEELLDDTEYEDIMADIRGESELHGKVLSISIPRPNKNDPDAIVPGLEKVYIEFASELDAIQARSKLEGRNFGDQTVGCEFLDEEKYKAREF